MQGSNSIIKAFGKIMLTGLLVYSSFSVMFCQIYNYGEIYMEEGAEMYINGSYENYPGAFITNRGSVFLTGDLINFSSESLFKEEKGQLVMTGVSHEIFGNDPLLGSLQLEDDQSLILNTMLTIDQGLQLSNGTLDLNGQTIILQSIGANSLQWDQGRILNDLSDSRLKWESPSPEETHEIPFSSSNADYVPLSFEVLSSSVDISVNTYPVEDNNEPLPEGILSMEYEGDDIGNKTIDRFWYIDPSEESVEITFNISVDDLNGNELPGITDFMLLKHNGDRWINVKKIEMVSEFNFITSVDEEGWYAIAALSTPVKELFEQELIVYPVPFSENIQIIPPENISEKVHLSVFDGQGRAVLEKRGLKLTGKFELDLETIGPGNYLIILSDSKNSLIYKKQLIKY